ncbi:MAG TPA: cytochrome c [Fimbriimonadaceae bacterium]|nr:cytochrome c [Fimbriimonadaceae bacterium]HRJ95205.1 cytochrome c [Fimbriimonadaceae bacterium]
MRYIRRLRLAALGLVVLAAGCHTDMWVQPKAKSQALSGFSSWEGQSASRTPVSGTVARGQVRLDDAYFTGFENGKMIDRFPIKVTKEVLERGQERFNIYCSHCHGRIGDGKGMIAQRGLVLARPPASYHTDRLREMPVGHFYDVITNGYGVMYRQAPNVDPADRWAIVAWLRVLQTSQNGRIQDVPNDQLSQLETPPTGEGN